MLMEILCPWRLRWAMIEIELPWPDKRLNPNARPNRYEKAGIVRTARDEACYLTMDAKQKLSDWYSSGLPYRIVAQYTFYPPDKRHRDIDNALSMNKAAQDGVFTALGIDDECIKRTILEWGEVVRGGRVTLRLEVLE